MVGALLTDLVAAHLVDGLHQVTDDVKLVEHQHRLGRPVLDDVDIGLPHIAANAFEDSGFPRPEEVEERFEGLLGASLAAPHQALALEVVDVGDVDVTALSRDLWRSLLVAISGLSRHVPLSEFGAGIGRGVLDCAGARIPARAQPEHAG